MPLSQKHLAFHNHLDTCATCREPFALCAEGGQILKEAALESLGAREEFLREPQVGGPDWDDTPLEELERER